MRWYCYLPASKRAGIDRDLRKADDAVPRPAIVPVLAAEASSSTLLNATSATTPPLKDAPGSRINRDAPLPNSTASAVALGPLPPPMKPPSVSVPPPWKSTPIPAEGCSWPSRRRSCRCWSASYWWHRHRCAVEAARRPGDRSIVGQQAVGSADTYAAADYAVVDQDAACDIDAVAGGGAVVASGDRCIVGQEAVGGVDTGAAVAAVAAGASGDRAIVGQVAAGGFDSGAAAGIGMRRNPARSRRSRR